MHRFFVPPNWIDGAFVELSEPVIHQVRNVLRLHPGDHIMLLDNRGWEYEVELTDITHKRAAGTVTQRQPVTTEPAIQITLYQSLLKKDNFEWVLQKCTEIGVMRFVPVISQRTVVTAVKPAKLARWERIITEAAEQSRRGALPDLLPVAPFEDAATTAEESDLALIPWEETRDQSLRDVIAARRDAGSVSSVAVFIGPEGGFAETEIILAERHGIRPVSLGPRILRAETAAVGAALLVLYALDESWHGVS